MLKALGTEMRKFQVLMKKKLQLKTITLHLVLERPC